MKWLKLISIFLLVSVSILAGLLLVLQENHYKGILSWGADQFLDSQLVIEGPLQLELSRNLVFSSSEITVHANDDSFQLDIGQLFISFRLGSYLQTGSFWFNDIKLSDIGLKVNETADASEFDLDELKIPPVIVNEARLDNINITYQELAPGTTHKFLLESLVLDEFAENKPMSLHATGSLENKPFKLRGTFDSITQVLNKANPVNLDVTLNSELINLNVKGSIVEPIEGRGIDLSLDGNIPRLTQIIEIVTDSVPELGTLKGAFHLQGDYSAPQLSDINLHLQHDQQTDFKVTGSVDNIAEGTGLNINFIGKSINSKLFSWISAGHVDHINSIELNTILKGSFHSLLLEDVSGVADTQDGAMLEVNGTAELYPEDYSLTKENAELNIKITAPSVQALNLIETDSLPDLGPINSQMKLALSHAAVGIYDLDLKVGRDGQNTLILKGDIGTVPFTSEPSLSEMKLQTEVLITSFPQFGKLIDIELPELGAGQLKGVLKTQGSILEMQNAELNITQGEQTQLNATGQVSTKLFNPELENIEADLNITYNAADFKMLKHLVDFSIPAIGPMSIRGRFVAKDTRLELKNMNIFAGTESGTNVLATGRVGTSMRDPSNVDVATYVEFHSTEIAQLAQTYDYDLPEVGPTRITAWMESKGSDLHIEDIAVLVGTERHVDLRAKGQIVTSLKKNATSIKVDYQVATSPLIAMFTDLQPKSLGRFEGDAVIADIDGDWGVESFNITSTNTDLYDIQFSGRYDDIENYDEGKINSNIVIDNPHKLAQALGIDFNGQEPYHQKGILRFQKGRLNYQGKSSLGRTDAQSNVSGYLEENKLVFEGSVQIPIFYLADLGFGSEVVHDELSSARDEQTDSYIFSRELFDLSFLNSFDLDLVIQVDEVESGDLTIDSITGHLKLNDGHLSAPVNLLFEGGRTDINLDVNAESEPEYSLSVIADDLLLGPILSQVQDQVPINGYTNINLELDSKGNSAHQIASNLNGEIKLGFENIRIPNNIVKLLSVDIFGWVLSSASQNTHANLNCVVMDFDVTEGLVKSAVIIADGPRMTIGGQIDLNLADETMDIVLIPKQKRRLFTSTAPVKISGPMRDPDVEAIPIRSAVQQVGSFMALGTGLIIPIAVVSTIWSSLGDKDEVGGGCDKIEKIGEMATEEVQSESNE